MKAPVTRRPGRRSRAVVAVLLAAMFVACTGGGSGPSETVERADWGDVFSEHGFEGTFVLQEVGADLIEVHDPERARTPRLPASTFKILNSMIALETRALSDVDEVISWDGVTREVESWNQDHTLRTGIEVSAVWAYQHIAEQVGEETMAEWVSRAEYGNDNIGGGITDFWLSGDLRISPIEQLEFLRRFVEKDLPFRPEVMAQVREILIRERGPDWTWSHKTGTALADSPALGWLVGITEHQGRTWVFALNVDLEPEVDLATETRPSSRVDLARALLRSAGALP